jgi:tRNA nucleotidyltransferase (CCA-adding enzyme)
MIAGNYTNLRASTRVDLLTRLTSRGILREMFHLELADKDRDHSALVQRELETILAVRLAPEDRDLGPLSAEKLRGQRIKSIAKALQHNDSDPKHPQ